MPIKIEDLSTQKTYTVTIRNTLRTAEIADWLGISQSEAVRMAIDELYERLVKERQEVNLQGQE